MKKRLFKTALVMLVSAFFSGMIYADTAPTTPGTPQAYRSTFNKAEFDWAASTDDVEVTGYKVYRDGTEIATVTDTIYFDTGLTANTSYIYTVKAVDSAGQLSTTSLPLIMTTLNSLTIAEVATIEQAVESSNPGNMNAAELITSVQNSFSNMGFDSSFNQIDSTILTTVIQARIDEINEPDEEPETPESREADLAEINTMLVDHFGSNSFLEVYIQANLVELAEKHYQNEKSASALTLFDYSLNYLGNVESIVFNTLNRMAYIKLQGITPASSQQDIIDTLSDAKNTMLRFFNYFPGSISHLAQYTYVRSMFNYFHYFPELLTYSNYNQQVYNQALSLVQDAKTIENSTMNATRLERISSWEYSEASVTIQDSLGNPMTGNITVTNVSDSSRYPVDPIEDSRTFSVSTTAITVPLYLGHAYDFTVNVDVQGGPARIWNLLDVPHAKGQKITYDHGAAPVITALADPNAPAEIVIISSQPDCPYNLTAEKFIDTFTLNWEWVDPAGFTLKEFKIYRAGTLINTVLDQTLAGIPLEIGNNTYTYTVIAYDTNDNPSVTSQVLTVTPDFTEEQQAYFAWLQEHFGNTPVYDYEDADNDGLTNYYEYLLGSDPNIAPDQNVKATITDAVPGLLAEYFPTDADTYYLPDFDSRTPASSEVITSFNFINNYGNIFGSGLSDYIAVRLQGYIDVPTDGKYRFYLNSNDGSELYIDDKRVINNDGRHSNREYSININMKSGVHAIEIWYFDYNSSATLEIDWAGPGIARTPLTGSHVWYTPNPTALLQETLIQNGDFDNDGILDMVEYQLGTDPTKADTDGDGVSDHDEIYNYETDALKADTDGDGASDYEELFVLFSNPKVDDVTDSITEILSINGSSATVLNGTWENLGDSIFANGRNGSLQYTLNVPTRGVYRLAIEATENNPYSTNKIFYLEMTVDDTYIGRIAITAPYNSNGIGHFYLPDLTAGNHTITLKWDNVVSNTFLRINTLKLQALGGPDNDNNGIPDWIDNRLAQLTQLTVPVTSQTSPVCVEGVNQLNIGTMAVSGFYTVPGEDPIAPVMKPTPGNKWYTDLTLSPTNATILSFSFQNGAAVVPKTVTWTETNAILDDDITIRVNDSLLLTGFPTDATTGTSVIGVNSEVFTINYNTQNDRNSVAYIFDTPGTYPVTATYTPSGGGTPVSGTLNVKVVSTYFSNPPVALMNKSRVWQNPNIAQEAVILADTHINLFETELQPNGRELDMNVTLDKTGYVIARLGENGPIMDSETIKVIRISIIPGGTHKVVETFPDGSIMVESIIILSHVPADLKIKLRIYTGGITFEDGTTERWVTAADFDEYGVYKYLFIRANGAYTGICHAIEIYQGDERVQ